MLRNTYITLRGHATDGRRYALMNLGFKVRRPTIFAEGMLAWNCMKFVERLIHRAHWTQLRSS